MKIKYTAQQKIEIIKEAEETRKKKEVASKYQIHLSTIYLWMSKMKNLDNRNEYLGIKLSLEEKNKLIERCRRLGYEDQVSRYVRTILFSKYIATENPWNLGEELFKTRGELNKIGSNINQIANYGNYLKGRNLSDDKIIKDLESLAEELRILISEHKEQIGSTIKKIIDI